MGNATAKARTEANEEKDRVDALIEALENKLETFQLEINSKRGSEAANNSKEVGGGRTVSRISDIRVCSQAGADEQLTSAIESFFQAATNSLDGAATNSLDGDKGEAKRSAVEGAKNLVSAGLSALFGTSAGQGMSKKSFIVLFLNNAFCRVDYYAYSYNVNAQVWGAQAKISGACYVADLSVLKIEDLLPSEIDFFLSQALTVSNDELGKVNKLKFNLVQSAILSRALSNPELNFKDLGEIAANLAGSQEAISEAFDSLNNYVSPFAVQADEENEKKNPNPTTPNPEILTNLVNTSRD